MPAINCLYLLILYIMKVFFKSGKLLFVFLLLSIVRFRANAAQQDYYQLKIYHLKTRGQESRLDNYLEKAYIPAIHRQGIATVGVFKPVKPDTSGLLVYVLTPFKGFLKLEIIDSNLAKDDQYTADGKDYLSADYKEPPYARLETIILKAFPKMTQLAIPQLTAGKTDRIYELRSYESATESYNLNKVKMFNDGDEVGLFKRLGFKAVFYAEVIAGSRMPNLMYMITFNNMAEHDKLWKNFGDDAYWKSLLSKPEYQNNVSHIDSTFLHPAPYSDL